MGFIRFFLLGVIVYALIKFFRKALEKNVNSSQSDQQASFDNEKSQQDPYQILGIERTATQEQVKAAYYQLMAQYHPDKVSHLGEEIQETARRKTQQINWAYNKIKI